MVSKKLSKYIDIDIKTKLILKKSMNTMKV